MKVYHEFEPVFDSESKILILGSIPSVKSRELGFYYMHPQNRFWTVLEALFDEKIENKKEFCLKKKIALWDTCASCEITSSSDASIKNIILNDLNIILTVAPIKKIFTTGKKAHQIYQKYLLPISQIEDICLPSTSPANAKFNLNDLIQEYQIVKEILEKVD